MRACTLEMHLVPVFHKSHFVREFTGECQGPGARRRLCASLRSAVEMHLDISQGPLFAEIYRKNARAQLEHPDQAPAFTLTVRTPQCGHAAWEQNLAPAFTPSVRTPQCGHAAWGKISPNTKKQTNNSGPIVGRLKPLRLMRHLFHYPAKYIRILLYITISCYFILYHLYHPMYIS